ncbi:hypothetical protein [Streptomyces sp. NPDC059076]|uniref:hypothetical protein n=1 Tax=unclassified Streptomyces TaxID=2593676 RepID=UPI003698ABEB
MTDWSQLKDAFGSAVGVPALLDRFEAAPSSVWPELMDRLCPQLDSAFTASFAALPRLARIAAAQEPEQRSWALIAAGVIVSCARRSPDGSDIRTTHASTIAELAGLTDECLGAVLEPQTYVLLLQAALAFDGVTVWDELLDGLVEGEYEVSCPHCGVELFLTLGGAGHFSSTEEQGLDGGGRRPLRPKAPQDLRGPSERLHQRAMSDGHKEVAEAIAHLFGDAECGDCGTVFPVAERVVAQSPQFD